MIKGLGIFPSTTCYFACATLLLTFALSESLYGQTSLLNSLERLDRNKNGQIEPDEVTPLSRPYLEQLTRVQRGRFGLSMDRPNPIERLQAAARAYYADSNGANGERTRPEGERTVKKFGNAPDEALVPEFGLPRMNFPYTQADLDFADRTLKSHDENKDGYIDRKEAARHEWTHRQPFADDLNKDGRLSRLEMTQRYARRRLLEGAAGELVKKAWRTGGEIKPSETRERRSPDQDRYSLPATLFHRFDANKNGRLEFSEAEYVGISPVQVDRNRDGELSRAELTSYLNALQEKEGDSPESLPEWFYELDTNRDGQVEMSEFTTNWTEEKLEEFASLDSNEDGILTTNELGSSAAAVGGQFSSERAVVLPPRKTIISEIEIDEDILIADLNLKLSITHSNVSFLDAFLAGPDGNRIELFTEVGGRDDHFDDTIFDDQSRIPITKGKPPFKGSFLPEAILKRQPSFNQYNGKSAKGLWQLVIVATRSERFGMLHNWSLIIKPQEKPIDDDG